MKTTRYSIVRVSLVIAVMLVITIASTRLRADTGTCGGAMIALPFTDVPASNIFFCSIAEAFFSGLTNGTSPTTYSPAANVTREQMAAFITRTQDSALRRGSRRAALNQWARPTSILAITGVGQSPHLVQSDGADLWVANDGGTVSRVRASDGQLLETWNGTTIAYGVLVYNGFIWVTGRENPGRLYSIKPSQPAGVAFPLPINLGANPTELTTDGTFIWTANNGTGPGTGSVSKVSIPPAVQTFTTGFSQPAGILYDGTNIWVTDNDAGTLLKLDASGAIIQTVQVGSFPNFPIYDGANIWVPNGGDNTTTVVRASTGAVIATLTGNGQDGPYVATFDGQRILVTNIFGNSVSLWKAADLSPLGSVGTGGATVPFGACSDGINFWIALSGPSGLARF